jgi:hypothetical protein
MAYVNIKGNNVFNGYSNFRDITNTPRTKMVAGSLNTFMPDGEKVEPRAGMAYWGAAGTQGTQTNSYWTLAHRIHSKYDDFVNVQGTKIPLRVFYSGTSAQGDVVEAWLPVYVAGVATSTSQWYQITATTTPTNKLLAPANKGHRYYWAEWWDTINLIPRVAFTLGMTSIGSWSGGVAVVTGVTGTTITTDGIWTARGFIDAPEGNPIVIVNGVEYTVTAGFGTNTITVASTAGVSVDDLVFSSVQLDDTLGGGTTYDVCSMINNQVYYMDWRQRNVYISWNRNQIESITVPASEVTSGLNDAVFAGPYTGTVTNNFTVTIDSVPPAFVYSGTGADTLTFDYSGYSGTGINTYQVVITQLITAGGAFQWQYISYVNGVVANVNPFQDPTGVSTFAGPFPLADGITFSVPTQVQGDLFPFGGGPYTSYSGAFTNGDSYTLTNYSGNTDTFSWSLDGVSQGAKIPVSLSPTALSQGISVTFSNLTGHIIGDKWQITAFPMVIQGWTNFTYTNPGRLPGQGFTLLLDSNGWTMQPQENVMYMNSAAGHYTTAKLVLASNLLTENVVIERLKSEPQNRVLYPYLARYIKNQFATISQDKTFDILGRQKFLELPQTKSISDEVRIDFETADWEDADILYFKRKIYFCIPRQSLIFVYDDYKKYWHTPMQFGKRISLLSVIDGKLIGHSYEQNESYELFTGLNDLGIFPIKTRMVFPYESFGERMGEKLFSAIGFEGYVLGSPVINYTINSGLGGCEGQVEGTIKPVMCLPEDLASLGKSGLGFHGLGNSPSQVIPHFYYIKTFDNQMFYMRNIEISCDSLDQRWSLISLGTDVSMAGINNESIVDRT